MNDYICIRLDTQHDTYIQHVIEGSSRNNAKMRAQQSVTHLKDMRRHGDILEPTQTRRQGPGAVVSDRK